MAKVPFSHKIDKEIADDFERMCEELGPPKYRILEAAIEIFSALPTEWKYVLRSNKQDDRQVCLDLIRNLVMSVKREKHGSKKKILESS